MTRKEKKEKKVKQAAPTSWLPILYQDSIRFAEEIISIEQQEAFAEVKVYASSKSNFLVVRNDPGAIVAYLTIDENAPFDEFYELLKDISKLHLQVSPSGEEWVKKKFDVYHAYKIRYYTIEPSMLLTHEIPNPARRLSEQMPQIKKMIAENPLFKVSIVKGINYGYIENNEIIAFGGEDFISEKLSIIAVWTDKKHRKRGLAHACVMAALQDILKTKRKPIYNCDILNVPSIKIAERLGFKPVCEFPCAYIGNWKLFRTRDDSKEISDSVFIE